MRFQNLKLYLFNNIIIIYIYLHSIVVDFELLDDISNDFPISLLSKDGADLFSLVEFSLFIMIFFISKNFFKQIFILFN